MFTVRKILVFCQESLSSANFVGKGHGVWCLAGPSWSSGCYSAMSPWGHLPKGQKCHLAKRIAKRVREERRKKVQSSRWPLNTQQVSVNTHASQTQPGACVDTSGGGAGTFLLRPQILPPGVLAAVSGGEGSRERGSKSPAAPSCQPLSSLLLSSHLDLAAAP